MKTENNHPNRRDFLKTVTAAGAGMALTGTTFAQATTSAPGSRKIKLGFDNFAVRAMNWKAHALLDHAALLKCDSILISDLDAFDNRNDDYLKTVKARGDELGIQIHLGTWSICPTSKFFKKNWGNTAEEHLALGIRMAKTLGSPVLRCILGRNDDRKTEGGIEARIADTVKVCKAMRSQAVDAGVKICVENHAGDMQAWELVTLVEAAGKDYVGVCMDSGNACWTAEDPLESLEILGPYVGTTSLRDSMVWEYADGAKVQWVAMGEGNVNWPAYIKRFAELCPGIPVHIETISGSVKNLNYLKNDYWTTYPKARAKDFAKFVALAKTGKQPTARKPAGMSEQDYQKDEIAKSIIYCRETLGLGMRA